MKTLTDVVADRILKYLGEKNMTQYRLAQKSGLPKETIKSIMRRQTKNVTLKTIMMICEGFGITLLEFLDDESFKPENLDLE